MTLNLTNYKCDSGLVIIEIYGIPYIHTLGTISTNIDKDQLQIASN
jgi:hypothetical protein